MVNLRIKKSELSEHSEFFFEISLRLAIFNRESAAGQYNGVGLFFWSRFLWANKENELAP